jgi:hypothetical protein
MRLCKITNLVNYAISVEDIGVMLPGRGSSCIVELEAANKSINLLEKVRLKQVLAKPVQPIMSVWPFIKRQPEPVAKVEQIVPVQKVEQTNKIMEDKFDQLNQQVNKLVELIGSGVSILSSIPQIQTVQTQIATQIQSQTIKENELKVNMQEPMFIPSKIIPDDAKANVKISKSEIKTDVDSSVDALKKLKKRQF